MIWSPLYSMSGVHHWNDDKEAMVLRIGYVCQIFDILIHNYVKYLIF